MNFDEDHLELDPLSIEDLDRRCPYYGNDSNQIVGTPPRSEKYFSVVMGTKKRNKSGEGKRLTTVQLWKNAVLKARNMGDVWEKFHLDTFPMETATRYRYHTLKQTWITDDVLVKMDPEPFNHGAMRSCFRLKKLSHFSHSHNWKSSANYVAKKYIETVSREVYFEDVKLQMDAKLWGEEYNRHNPPKKVDIIQVCVLEFTGREGRPLYHLEHFIEGNYIKYNSNSGYVEDDKIRMTPQALSHFTFERSGHELILVDIQGVGDLYTDPQIHTISGKEYNEGNLGTRGMALFFHSHVCNTICEKLGLSRFDLASSEENSLQRFACFEQSSETEIRGPGPELCISPSEHSQTDWHEYFRRRTSSECNRVSGGSISPSISVDSQGSIDDDPFHENESGYGSVGRRQRKRYDSCSVTDEHEKLAFSALLDRKSRPSCVQHEMQYRILRQHGNNKTGGSVLGQIHLELAKYHEVCRFSSPAGEGYDQQAGFFHLEHAAMCGNLEAILNMARILLGLQHDVLVDFQLPESEDNVNRGVEFIQIAAEAGDRSSMIFMAKAYDTGFLLGTERHQSWDKAMYWYDKAVYTTDNDESGDYDGCIDDPDYHLMARQAEMYMQGGYDLDSQPEKAAELFESAADAAMAAMEGKLANKYYGLAEKAWALVQ